MQKLASRKAVLAMALALVLAAGGIATASNMGFKFVKNYSNVSPNINSVSLPYFQSQFAKASDLFNDVSGATQVCEFTAAGTFNCWTPSSFNNFNIVNQNGYAVGVGSAVTQVIVGSHDPSLAVSLSNVSPNINVKSIPYHATYTQAHQIFNDVTGATQVCQVTAAGTFNCWTPSSFNNFSIVIGQAYGIGVSAATTWTPDHY